MSPGEHTITFQAQYSGSTSSTAPIAPPVDSNTLAKWNLDEGSGTNYADSSSNGYDLNSYCNVPTWTSDSKYGAYALEFDGSSSTCTGIRYSGGSFGSVPTAMTAEAWIKLDLSLIHI